MRTELKRKKVLLIVPTEIGYQYDDDSESGPHFVEWRGTICSGKSEKDAKMALGLKIGGALLEDCESY